MTVPQNDGPVDVEALILDRYLEALLAATPGRQARADDREVIDPMLREAADVLRRSLVRIHPSFQFEERLGARLAAMATGDAGGSWLGTLIPFRPGDRGADDDAGARELIGGDRSRGLHELPAARRSAAVRPLLIGGAITSAALSLAGVAWVARRAVRTPALAELDGLL